MDVSLGKGPPRRARGADVADGPACGLTREALNRMVFGPIQEREGELRRVFALSPERSILPVHSL